MIGKIFKEMNAKLQGYGCLYKFADGRGANKYMYLSGQRVVFLISVTFTFHVMLCSEAYLLQ